MQVAGNGAERVNPTPYANALNSCVFFHDAASRTLNERIDNSKQIDAANFSPQQ